MRRCFVARLLIDFVSLPHQLRRLREGCSVVTPLEPENGRKVTPLDPEDGRKVTPLEPGNRRKVTPLEPDAELSLRDNWMIALLCYGFIYYVFKHLGTPTAYATYILLLCRLALGMRRDFLQEGNLVRLSIH